MIRAEFDVNGNNLDELTNAGHRRAVSLVGAKDYTMDMLISPRMPAAPGQPWVAECTITVEDNT